jgi:hypothetical protein
MEFRGIQKRELNAFMESAISSDRWQDIDEVFFIFLTFVTVVIITITVAIATSGMMVSQAGWQWW